MAVIRIGIGYLVAREQRRWKGRVNTHNTQVAKHEELEANMETQ